MRTHRTTGECLKCKQNGARSGEERELIKHYLVAKSKGQLKSGISSHQMAANDQKTTRWQWRSRLTGRRSSGIRGGMAKNTIKCHPFLFRLWELWKGAQTFHNFLFSLLQGIHSSEFQSTSLPFHFKRQHHEGRNVTGRKTFMDISLLWTISTIKVDEYWLLYLLSLFNRYF